VKLILRVVKGNLNLAAWPARPPLLVRINSMIVREDLVLLPESTGDHSLFPGSTLVRMGLE
jgi:hypothetical protein